MTEANLMNFDKSKEGDFHVVSIKYLMPKHEYKIFCYCKKNINYMWAAKIVGIMFDIDFKDSASFIKNNIIVENTGLGSL